MPSSHGSNQNSGFAINGPNQIVGNAAEQNAVGFSVHYESGGSEVHRILDVLLAAGSGHSRPNSGERR
jgi:hypothetical protein